MGRVAKMRDDADREDNKRHYHPYGPAPRSDREIGLFNSTLDKVLAMLGVKP